MKDCQQRWKLNSRDSVIGMLMGFDELRPQRPDNEKRRVLSESYVRKAASVGLRSGSSFSIGRSRGTNSEIVCGAKGASGVQICNGKNENALDKCVNASTGNVRTSVRRQKPAGALVSKSAAGGSYEDGKSIGKKGEHCAKRHVLMYQQRVEHDLHAGHLRELGIGSKNNSLKSQLEKTDKPRLLSTSIRAFKPKSDEVAYDLDDIKSDLNSRPGYNEHRKSLMPNSGKPYHDRELYVNGIVSPKHSCIACTRAMNRFSLEERHRSKFEWVSKPGCKNYSHNPHLLLDQSSLDNKSRKNFERCKTAKEVEEFVFSGRHQTLKEMLALADKKSMLGNLDARLGRNGLFSTSSLQSRSSDSSGPSVFSSLDVLDDDCLKSLPEFEFEARKEILSNGWNLEQDESTANNNKSKVQTTAQEDILESKSGRGSEQFQTSVGVDDTMSPSSKVSELSSDYFSCFGSSYNNHQAYIQGVRDATDNCFEDDSCKEIELSQRNSKSSIRNLAAQYITDASYASAEAFNAGVGCQLEEGEHSSNVEEVFSKKASLNEFSEEESPYSNCCGIGPPESMENLKRTYQHSPDSVLEPFDMQNSSSFECLDSIGLRLQLEALHFESEETSSEGSVMVVSGDEDSGERSGDLSHDGREVKRWLGDYESRNFSYLVDVLDEAGFYDMNSFMDFSTWCSLECPIRPLVFETLEKKYGKQTSWHKSERQLLFDRINSGLVAIFNPVINFHVSATSIQRRFCSSFRRDEFEDKLWTMLISQEKEKSKNLSEKALDKWSESEEGIHIICSELESSLFDELVMEFAS